MPAGHCTHLGHRTSSCSAWCLHTFAKCFAVGSLGKTLLNVLLFALFKRRGGKRRGGGGVTWAQLRGLIDVRYGLFLGTYSGGWKALSCLLRRWLAASRRRPPPSR